MPNQTETELAPSPPQEAEVSPGREPGRLKRFAKRAGQFIGAAAGLAIVFGPAASEVPVVQETPVLLQLADAADAFSDVATEAVQSVPGAGLEVPGTDVSVSRVSEVPNAWGNTVETVVDADRVEPSWTNSREVQMQTGASVDATELSDVAEEMYDQNESSVHEGSITEPKPEGRES